MRALILGLAVMLLALGGPALAQQAADAEADVTVAWPVWPTGTGPRVVIDGGHHNFHTVDGRFAPFATVLRNDGFRVEGRTTALTAQALADVDILVIANPLNAANEAEWKLPTSSAFTPAEVAAIKAWVEGGGALLLIADHMPFPGAAADLAQAFGFSFSNGFAMREPKGGPDFFSIADGTLKDDPVTRGRDDSERVDRLRTYTGSAFLAPPGARPLIVFPRGYVSLEPQVAWEFDPQTPSVDVEGRLQGAVLEVGTGRVAVFGEAAMFTAQASGPNKTRFGFNAPDATRNKQFLLNVMHWLAGVRAD